MTPDDYLKSVLKDQEIPEGSAELKDLQAKRKEVDGRLRSAFSECSSTAIREGGSKAKGTMIKESYDLDLTCYFPFDEASCGDTLEEIFKNVEEALEEHYEVERKTSALRLKDEDGVDFHVDVVPGRFVDETESDTWIYRAKGDKSRLKTNLQTHIDFVRDSGVTEGIRLMKLWRRRMQVGIRTFPLELMVIELLKRKKNGGLDEQLTHMMKKLRDEVHDVVIEDPANPTGNDLSELFNDEIRDRLQEAAKRTLELVKERGWEGVFEKTKAKPDVARLKRAAQSVPTPTRPWCPTEE